MHDVEISSKTETNEGQCGERYKSNKECMCLLIQIKMTEQS